MNNNRTTIPESEKFAMRFRGTVHDLRSVKFYTNKNSIQIKKQISFDSESAQISSIEYFAASLLSSILLTLLEQSKKQEVLIEDIEGVLKFSLENPLSLVGVKGYEEEPSIRQMNVTIFLYAHLDDDHFEIFCNEALQKSPLYNTFKRSMELDVVFKNIV